MSRYALNNLIMNKQQTLSIEKLNNSNNVLKKMSLKKIACSIIATSFLPCSFITHASDIQVLPYAVGEFEVSARLDTSLIYGDNVFRGSSQEESLAHLTIDPTVQAVNENARRRITLNYEGEAAIFFQDDRDDNYLSTELGAEYLAKFGVNHELGFGIGFEDGNSIRGTEILEGSDSEITGPSEFQSTTFRTNYLIGSSKIGPVIELGYEYNDLEFTNFDEFNEGRDRVSNSLTARIGYQYSVATQFFIDLAYTDFDYDGVIPNFGASLDNSEERVEVGVKWRATRQTSGEFSIGVTDKDFDDFDDPSSITSWKASIDWLPTSRDTISISTFSRPSEQSGTGLFIDVQQYDIKWNHKVSSLWGFNASWSTGSADFEGNVRDDDYDTYQIGVTYRPTKFSLLSLGISREEKESNVGDFDFDTNSISLTYSTSL